MIEPEQIEVGKHFWLIDGLGNSGVHKEIVLQYPVQPQDVPGPVREAWRQVGARIDQPFVAARDQCCGQTGRQYHPVGAYCVTRAASRAEAEA